MKRILIVDDKRVIADTLATILGNSGYSTMARYDAQSALCVCESGVPDLVIIDVMMPGMNGIELAIEMRKRHPNCAVLLFSGMSESADLLDDARLQGHDFQLVSKPIHPSDLLSKLKAS